MMQDSNTATLSFYGGAGTVTGAHFLLEGARTRLLIDCGLIQGEKFAAEQNRKPFPYDPASIQYLLVTHAHIDHSGRIPKLVRDGFRGTIWSTPETRALSELMLADALSVMQSECEKGEALLYEKEDIARALALWKTISYHQTLALGDEFEVVLKDAGHILGSAMCEITKTTEQTRNQGNTEPPRNRKIVFTGDLGNSPSPLLRDTEAVTSATYFVMESVYGDRNHENQEERRERLAQVIRTAVERGGTLLIPCFSLEKTQVLLHEMNDLLAQKQIPSVPVFLDSPLAIQVTQVYRAYTDNFNEAAKKEIAQGDDIFKFPNLRLTETSRASSVIERAPNPKIIIAGSGMSTGGRIIGHEKRYLSGPNNMILFVGYQAAGSLGRQIQEGVQKVRIGEEDMSVRARVETISGYSSHKDRDHLLDFVSRAADLPAEALALPKPSAKRRSAQAGDGALEKVFVTMGEPKASFFLAQRIRDYVGVEAVVPQLGDSVEISL